MNITAYMVKCMVNKLNALKLVYVACFRCLVPEVNQISALFYIQRGYKALTWPSLGHYLRANECVRRAGLSKVFPLVPLQRIVFSGWRCSLQYLPMEVLSEFGIYQFFSMKTVPRYRCLSPWFHMHQKSFNHQHHVTAKSISVFSDASQLHNTSS